MKKLAICLVFSLTALQALAWGGKGHAIVAQIAQENLSCRAERRVTKILDGHPMTYYASWADDLRGDARYNAFSTWHYANLAEGKTYAEADKNPKGDVVTAVEMLVGELKSGHLSDSVEALYVRLLIHFVGDLHCPMHTGYASNQGGNGFRVKFMGESTSIHAVWDDKIVNSARPWSYSEWVENIDLLRRRERKAIAEGTPREWIEQTGAAFHSVYDPLVEGETLSWGYMKQHFPTLEAQLQRGGYRLAEILNEIY